MNAILIYKIIASACIIIIALILYKKQVVVFSENKKGQISEKTDLSLQVDP